MKWYLKIFLGLIIVADFAIGLYLWKVEQSTQVPYVRTQNAPQQTSQTNPQSSEINFLAVGDIMLSRNVAGTMQKNNKDSFLPFRELDPLLTGTDFNFANLESPFSGKDDFNPTGSLVFNAPTWAIDGLSQYNFKVLNLANNHAFDQGKAGILYTKQILAKNYLKGIGVGNNLDEAWQGDTFTAKGITVGFIGASYSSQNDGGATTNNYVARIEDLAHLKTSIKNMKTKSDFIVVTMHAGIEYTRTPNAAQTAFAHAAIDAGADIVIGAHPHWAQTFEKYKDKYIFYSLGNFVFDQMWSQDTKEGLTLKITLDKTGGENTTALKQIQLIPVIIENYSTPRLANESEKQSILKKIGATTDVITP